MFAQGPAEDWFFKIAAAAMTVAVPFLWHELRRVADLERACSIHLATIIAEQKLVRLELETKHLQNTKILQVLHDRVELLLKEIASKNAQEKEPQ